MKVTEWLGERVFHMVFLYPVVFHMVFSAQVSHCEVTILNLMVLSFVWFYR